MFQVEVKTDTLKEFIGVLATLVDEAKFNITEDGINVKAVDPAHVAMVDLNLKGSAFNDFKASEVELGIDINRLNDVLKLSKPTDSISITHDEETNRLILKIENITRRMSLVDTTGMSDPKVPNVPLPVTVVIKTTELSQGIRASESIADHISLSVSPEGFELSSEGETDSVNLKLTKDLLEKLECKENVKSLFSLDYFSNMIKSVTSSNTVTMHLGTDYPVKLEFEIAGGEGHVEYLLAPRIESD